MSNYTGQLEINKKNPLLCRVILPNTGGMRECLGATWYVLEDGTLYCGSCKSKTFMASLTEQNEKRRKA